MQGSDKCKPVTVLNGDRVVKKTDKSSAQKGCCNARVRDWSEKPTAAKAISQGFWLRPKEAGKNLWRILLRRGLEAKSPAAAIAFYF